MNIKRGNIKLEIHNKYIRPSIYADYPFHMDSFHVDSFHVDSFHANENRVWI